MFFPDWAQGSGHYLLTVQISGIPDAAPIRLEVPSLLPPTCLRHSSHASLVSGPQVGQLQSLCVSWTPTWIFPDLSIADSFLTFKVLFKEHLPHWAWMDPPTSHCRITLSYFPQLNMFMFTSPVKYVYVYFTCLLSLAQFPLDSRMSASWKHGLLSYS